MKATYGRELLKRVTFLEVNRGLVFTNISQQSMLSWIPYCIGESLEFVQKFYTVLKRSTTGARVRDGGGGVVLHKSFRIL